MFSENIPYSGHGKANKKEITNDIGLLHRIPIREILPDQHMEDEKENGSYTNE